MHNIKQTSQSQHASAFITTHQEPT